MTLAETLLPAAVLLPLGLAALLTCIASWLPPRIADALACLTALAVLALCGWLAHQAMAGPIAHWFGGWTPDAAHRPGVVLGIGFLADPASAAIAGFCALLFLATFAFSWGHFDRVHSHFHILMLLFLAAMQGFCLTHDLFNLFVWFELMSVAAFALTAYPLGQSSLEGAFNFTVTNSLGSFLMLAGIGLLYARTGTLDFTALGHALARGGDDPVAIGGFCLIAVALLTKAAIFPFHLWLSDAHAVAPPSVSVIFSGAMVGLGLFALAKLTGQVFAGVPAVLALVHHLLLRLGVATMLVGAMMAWCQRHLKRLLAFSTIAHLGIMLTALSTLRLGGIEGLLLYFAGHALVKAPLFMIAGLLLALRSSADEIVLYGQGRKLWPAGVAMIVAGCLLGGVPVGLVHDATARIDACVATPVFVAMALSTALTGGAVVRAGLRVFAGWSGAPGPEHDAPTERETELRDRPAWLMLAPALAMIVIALAPASAILPGDATAALRGFMPVATGSAPGVDTPFEISSLLAPALMLLLVVGALLRRRPVSQGGRAGFAAERGAFGLFQTLHSGLVGDYVTWMAVGLAGFVVALAWV